MQTIAPAPIFSSTTVSVRTAQPTQFIDLTDQLDQIVKDTGLWHGILNVQSLHTTTAIVVNEH